ncbi:MAG: helix-turn-helix transcriptional regulator [Bacilli bacterium]
MKLNQLLLKCRQKENLSQQEVADKLFYSVQVISKWENGFSSPSIDIMVNIANLFKIDILSFINGEIIEKNEPYVESFDLKKFINRFKIIRQNKQISHYQMAKDLKKSKSFMIRLEKGEVIPKIPFYVDYVNFYKLDPLDTYFGTPIQSINFEKKNKTGLVLSLIGLSAMLAGTVIVSTLYVQHNNDLAEDDKVTEIISNPYVPSDTSIPEALNNLTITNDESIAIRFTPPTEAKKSIHSFSDYVSFLANNVYYLYGDDEIKEFNKDTWYYGKSVENIYQDGHGNILDYANLTNFFMNDIYDECGILNVIYQKDFDTCSQINYVKTNDKYYFFETRDIIRNNFKDFQVEESDSLEDYTKNLLDNNSYISFIIDGSYEDGLNIPFSFIDDLQQNICLPSDANFNYLYNDEVTETKVSYSAMPFKFNRYGCTYQENDIKNVTDFDNAYSSILGEAKLSNEDFKEFDSSLDIDLINSKINTVKDLLNYTYYRGMGYETKHVLYNYGPNKYKFNYDAKSILKKNLASDGGIANLFNYLLKDDYEEVGFINCAFSSINSYVHPTNYIKQNNVYYFFDLYTWIAGYSDQAFITSNFNNMEEYIERKFFLNSKDAKILIKYQSDNDIPYIYREESKIVRVDSNFEYTKYILDDNYSLEPLQIQNGIEKRISFRRLVSF